MYDCPRADKKAIRMRLRRLLALIAGGLIVTTAASSAAQSLADVAKKEEERRKQTPAGKVYTNKDLPSVPPSSTAPPPDAVAADEKPAKEEKTADDKSGDKTADKAADKTADNSAAEKSGPAKDQKFWHDRMQAARLALERDTGYADAMQTRVNALTTDFVNRDDPAQRSVIERDRQRALSELERLRKQIIDDKKAIADLEEEARRAGVPPGWLR